MAPRKVTLLRHAQSTWNAAIAAHLRAHPEDRGRPSEDLPDPMLFDADLTEEGWEQAFSAAGPLFVYGASKPDLIVSSPFTRTLITLQCALKAMEGEWDLPPPVVVQPDLRERLTASCDIGRPLHELKKALHLANPQILLALEASACHFSNPECWWADMAQEGSSGPPLTEELVRRQGGVRVEQRETMQATVERMWRFLEWLGGREEEWVVLICHGDIIHIMTDEHFGNCQHDTYEYAELCRTVKYKRGQFAEADEAVRGS